MKQSRYDLRAAARPPLRPAAFFCAVVPPCDALLRDELEEPDFLPPRLEEPEELAILAARSFDMPFSLSLSYCFSFLMLELLLGMNDEYPSKSRSNRVVNGPSASSRPTATSVGGAAQRRRWVRSEVVMWVFASRES